MPEAITLDYTWTIYYANIAGAALVVYDYLLTLPDEVRFIWPAKWNVAKIAFFLTRYVVFIDAILICFAYSLPSLGIGPYICKPLYQACAWVAFAGIVIAENIMVLRVYAMWGAKKRVVIILVTISGSFAIYDAFKLQKRINSLDFVPASFPHLRTCILSDFDGSSYKIYVLVMIFEFIIAAMTFWKWFSEWRQSESPLMKTLLEDGIQYFVCMFATSCANVLVMKLANADISLLFMIQQAFHSILAARILLHIRKVARPVVIQETSNAYLAGFSRNYTDVTGLSQMNFGEEQDCDTYGGTGSQTRSYGV